MYVGGVCDILINVKTAKGSNVTILTEVLFVSTLGRSLFSCYRAAQKGIFTLHMRDGCQLIHEG
jgi:hypothetical protein